MSVEPGLHTAPEGQTMPLCEHYNLTMDTT